MGAPGTADDVSTARLEDLSVNAVKKAPLMRRLVLIRRPGRTSPLRNGATTGHASLTTLQPPEPRRGHRTSPPNEATAHGP